MSGVSFVCVGEEEEEEQEAPLFFPFVRQLYYSFPFSLASKWSVLVVNV